MKKLLVFVSLCLITVNINAAPSFNAKVLRVGCHADQNTCFVYIDRDTPETQCTNDPRSIRWDGLNIKNAQSILSIFLVAQSSEKTVTFGRPTDVCFDNYPSFNWVDLNN
ncbi:hypothetical protein [Sessilibacter corallicola]|uniref:Secreted protein n=1 Tax=Sessilibacter corallicola TaxID=2904075 RepID=A0ABQ0A8B8_9GAMM